VKYCLFWKLRLLALDITESSVGLAFAPHPSQSDGFSASSSVPVAKIARGKPELKSLSNLIKISPKERKFIIQENMEARRTLDSKVSSLVKEALEEFDIGGFVVAWPLLSNGRMGLDAGRVLFLLDHFAENDDENDKPILSKTRPAVLWERGSYGENNTEEITANELIQCFMRENGMINIEKIDMKYRMNRRSRYVEEPEELNDRQARIII